MISNHTKCISLSYQKFIIQLALINLHPVNYSQDFQYYLSAANKDRCIGSCNFLNDLSKEVCVPNKTEDLNISVFNMITEKNESKILTKDRSCECTCKFDGTKCNSNQKWNNDKQRCKCKKHNLCERDYIWKSTKCSCKNGKYLESITDKSVITCDDIIDERAKSNDKETNNSNKFS